MLFFFFKYDREPIKSNYLIFTSYFFLFSFLFYSVLFCSVHFQTVTLNYNTLIKNTKKKRNNTNFKKKKKCDLPRFLEMDFLDETISAFSKFFLNSILNTRGVINSHKLLFVSMLICFFLFSSLSIRHCNEHVTIFYLFFRKKLCIFPTNNKNNNHFI